MFAVIYQFNIKPEKESQFINAWEHMTSLIYEYEGSLGSRLHRQSNSSFIAYAQWPNETTFLNSGENLPDEAKEVRAQMREACLEVKKLYELESVLDLLQSETKTLDSN